MSGERRSRRINSSTVEGKGDMDFKKLGDQISGLKTSFELQIANLSKLIEDNINTTKLKMEAQDKKISDLEAELRTQKTVNTKQSKQIKDLTELLDDTISHSRRLNLLVDGLPEVVKENTEGVVCDFLVRDLKVPSDDVDRFVFRDLHRLGAWVARDGNVYRKPANVRGDPPTQPRSIIIAFTVQSQRNQAMSCAKNLKDTAFSIKPDLSAEQSKLRNKLLTIRRDIKLSDRRKTANLVYHSYKPKLLIKLDGQTVEYENGMDIESCE